MIKFNICIFLLTILVSCNGNDKRKLNQKSNSQKMTFETRSISNENFKVKINLEDEKISFEILKGKNKKVVRVKNTYGKLSFTSSLPVISYKGDSIQVIEHFFYKNDFLVYPLEDWNGNRIFYKISLNENSINDKVEPLFILKEQYCLFNQSTGTVLMYEKLNKEYFIDQRSYYLTKFNLIHFDNNKVDNIQFHTQKEIGIVENLSPVLVKKQLLEAIGEFYEMSFLEAYFK